MAKTREIKKRIKAVGNIRRITKTMQMIATSKFARAQQRAVATRPYTLGIFDLVTELAATAGNVAHPLIDGPSGGPRADARPLTLVITSDRGLCGPYNAGVLRAFMAMLRNEAGVREGRIELIGRKGLGFMKYNKITPSRQHANLGDKPSFQDVERIAQEYMDWFVAGEVSSVRVVYVKYISAGRQTPDVLQLLPLKPPTRPGAEKKASAQYEFSPDAEGLLGSLLPATVKATLFQCMNDAIVSEHVSRMIAMKAATDAAGKMGKRLTQKYNRARQAQITTELTEIISGAAALG